jgi:hypothetical protein
MKVRSKAHISGAVGERAPGDEFTVDAKTVESLLARDLVEPVEESPAKKAEKPAGKE